MTDATTSPVRRQQRATLLWMSAACIVMFAAAGLLFWWAAQPDLPAGVTTAEYDAAIARFQADGQSQPGENAVLLLIGQTALSEARLDVARACFSAIPDSDPRFGTSARLQGAQVALRLDLAREAEQNFRTFLSMASRRRDIDPMHVLTARQWLAYLLSAELRIEERQVVLRELHQSGRANVYDSKQLYLPNLLIWPSPVGRRKVKAFLEKDPNDPMLLTAWGRYLTAEGNPAAAREILEPLCNDDPKDLRRAAALLEATFEQSDWRSFEAAYQRMPPYRDFEPWLLTRLRARFALQQANWQEAVEQFERVLLVDPSDPASHAGLARAYGELDRTQDRDRELKVSATLAPMRVELVRVTEEDADASSHLAAQCREIGLLEAAETFSAHAARIARATPGG